MSSYANSFFQRNHQQGRRNPVTGCSAGTSSRAVRTRHGSCLMLPPGRARSALQFVELSLGMESPNSCRFPLGFFANSTVFSDSDRHSFSVPAIARISFRSHTTVMRVGQSGPIGTKGNYGVSWGNTYWGQDNARNTAFAPMTTRGPGWFPSYRKPAFGFLQGRAGVDHRWHE